MHETGRKDEKVVLSQSHAHPNIMIFVLRMHFKISSFPGLLIFAVMAGAIPFYSQFVSIYL